MRATWKIALTAGVAVLLAQCVQAQQQRGGRGGPGGDSGYTVNMLLANASVQKELKLTDEQKEQVKELTTKLIEQAQKIAAIQDQAERREKMTQNLKARTEEANKAMARILKPDQVTRFKQIVRQTRTQPFADPDVQKVLKLSDEQKDKWKTINEAARAEMGQLFPREIRAAGRTPEEMAKVFEERGKKRAAFKKEVMAKNEAVLNADQKKAWKELFGEPFELKIDYNNN